VIPGILGIPGIPRIPGIPGIPEIPGIPGIILRKICPIISQRSSLILVYMAT